jgi:hypothetical protein
MTPADTDDSSGGASYDVAAPRVSLEPGGSQIHPSRMGIVTVEPQARESEAPGIRAFEEVHIKIEPLERLDGLRDSVYGTPATLL